MSPVRAVISDFGGVLTSPLVDAFVGVQTQADIPLDALGRALQTVTERDGAHPLFELETGRMTEADFLARLEGALAEQLGRHVDMRSFGERYFSHLRPNERLIAYLGELRDRGVRLALCTNNVKEWEARWRAMLPVDELFEVVVDSGWVGMRKPEPGIYELTLEGLGLPASECVFLDDVEVNVQAARALGLPAVWFRETEQAIAELEAVLGAE